ncbi:MAG TPA: DUF1109 domain-containing protein [Caulobacteraceae bacterium]
MKTADLIFALSSSASPARGAPVRRRLAAAAALGAVVAFVVLAGWLGVRPLTIAADTPSFWMKVGYTLCISLAGLELVGRLSRPDGRPHAGLIIIILIVAVMAVLAGVELARTPRVDVAEVWLGQSWSQCPFRILALGVPVYLAIVWVMRRLAPTRLGMAGAAAGTLAGAVGATVYGLYCQETTAAFVATWYTLGIAASAALGGLIGSRLLRW